MKKNTLLIYLFLIVTSISSIYSAEGLPLYYYREKHAENFGDHLSLKLVERIVGGKVQMPESKEKKLLAIGSILPIAKHNDVLWGTGMNAKRLDLKYFRFKYLDIRAIRGPLTRQFILDNFDIHCPETYGDPALLVPYFFPEFKKPQNPSNEYIVIPHYKDNHLFPRELYPNVVYPTEPWNVVIRKILNSKFVISGSLHGLIVAEAYGIPARYLRVSDYEPLFKYYDYYLGTNRSTFTYATTIEEALEMGGEPPFKCDLELLYNSFPFEYWPNANFMVPNFNSAQGGLSCIQ